MQFLKEYWPWIVTPIVLVFLALVVLMMSTGGGNDDQPFIYNIW